MDYLIVYDICQPKRLRRVAKAMQQFGVRVQKSVFECVLSDSGLSEMKTQVSKDMDATEDSVRIYPLLAGSREKQTILGNGVMHDFPAAMVV
jgi:CRISPR-associated protein Cas2